MRQTWRWWWTFWGTRARTSNLRRSMYSRSAFKSDPWDWLDWRRVYIRCLLPTPRNHHKSSLSYGGTKTSFWSSSRISRMRKKVLSLGSGIVCWAWWCLTDEQFSDEKQFLIAQIQGLWLVIFLNHSLLLCAFTFHHLVDTCNYQTISPLLLYSLYYTLRLYIYCVH